MFLVLLAAAFGPARSSQVLASSHAAGQASAKTCKKGYKLVKGKCQKVVKKKATPTPQPTDAPCTNVSCEAPSKFWQWKAYVVVGAPQSTTSYLITGTTCGRPANATWNVQYTYTFNENGDISTKTYYDDGKTTLQLPQDTFVTFPLANDPDFPNPDLLKIELRYDTKGHIRPGISYADEVTPRVTVLPPFKVKGLAAPAAAIPKSDCASG